MRITKDAGNTWRTSQDPLFTTRNAELGYKIRDFPWDYAAYLGKYWVML